ncbi:hypothetical protein EGW08_015135 [Elysia chlorotica]|uniref:Uncharacterized protein n=1 Tax=Elysia chlorotica TaxID=188477 RepID=A0A3S1B686_ELYCH|nr:hypothetical protein EGW08_015135 [Elysia chlorotica]
MRLPLQTINGFAHQTLNKQYLTTVPSLKNNIACKECGVLSVYTYFKTNQTNLMSSPIFWLVGCVGKMWIPSSRACKVVLVISSLQSQSQIMTFEIILSPLMALS